MPRLKREPKAQEKLGVLIAGTMSQRGMPVVGTICQVLGCSEATARKKRDCPEKLTIDELVRLCHGVGIPAEDLRAAIKF